MEAKKEKKDEKARNLQGQKNKIKKKKQSHRRLQKVEQGCFLRTWETKKKASQSLSCLSKTPSSDTN